MLQFEPALTNSTPQQLNAYTSYYGKSLAQKSALKSDPRVRHAYYFACGFCRLAENYRQDVRHGDSRCKEPRIKGSTSLTKEKAAPQAGCYLLSNPAGDSD